MSLKGSPPPQPSYQPLAAASEAAAQLQYQTSQEQLAWARDQYNRDREILDPIVHQQMDIAAQNQQNAQEDRTRYQQVFQPLENQLAQDAQTYASPERKALEMGRAEADVAQQMSATKANAQRDLQAFGINPSAVKYAGLDAGLEAARGAAQAAAGTQANQRVEDTARALRSEAINVGRGYPGQIAGQYGLGLQGGSAAANTQLAGTASGANTMGTGVQYAGLGNQAITGAGNIMNQGYQNQLAAWQANQNRSSGLGSLAGAALGFFLADGGEVPPAQQALPLNPNAVPPQASPSGGRAIDDVPARLTAGEFVLPKDVVNWMGEEKLQKMIQKVRQDKAGGTVAKAKAKPALPAPPTYQSPSQGVPLQ